VGDHEERGPLGGDLVEPLQDVLGGGQVQGGRGLVGQDDLGAGRQDPGDSDPLALTAAHLGGHVAGLTGQPHPGQGGVHLPPAQPPAPQAAGQGHVVAGVQAGDQVVLLEDHAHVRGPEGGQGARPQGRRLPAQQTDRARGRVVQARHAGQQGRLAAARGPDHRREGAGCQVQVHARQRHHALVPTRHREGARQGAHAHAHGPASCAGRTGRASCARGGGARG